MRSGSPSCPPSPPRPSPTVEGVRRRGRGWSAAVGGGGPEVPADRSAAIFTEARPNAFPGRLDPHARRSAVIWIFLDVKHEELATDGPRASAPTDPARGPRRPTTREGEHRSAGILPRGTTSLRKRPPSRHVAPAPRVPRPLPPSSAPTATRSDVPDLHVTTYDPPTDPLGRGARPARRQASRSRPGRRRPQRLLAAGRLAGPLRRTAGRGVRCHRAAAALTASADGSGTDRVADAREALAEVPRHPRRRTGRAARHSMGARVAVHVADDPSGRRRGRPGPLVVVVRPGVRLAGRTLRAAHGRRDRITSFRETTRYVERARPVADSAELRDMGALGTTCSAAPGAGTTSPSR